jgi:uncharacterized YigZ family protein
MRLEEVRKIHPKARHFCFAYRLGTDGNQFRANDDGEPAGSAGRPILGQIDSFGLTNVIVIVVRYFGGTLLGVPGLIAAYKGSAQIALDQSEKKEYIIRTRFQIRFDYALTNGVMHALKKLGFDLLRQEYSDTSTTIEIAVRKNDAKHKILEFKALSTGLHLEEVEKMTAIHGLELECLGDT